MTTSSAEISFLLAMAVTVIIFAARLAKEPVSAFFKSFTLGIPLRNILLAERLIAAKSLAPQKNCPNCAEPTPISALFCDACDYNFLSGTIGSRQKSLPAPAAMMGHASKPSRIHSQA
jgi:hypothetical protein